MEISFSSNDIKKTYNRPNVGIVSPATISKTPLSDTIEIKKEENPHIKYELPKRKYSNLGIQKVFQTAIIAIGSLPLICKIFKRK